MFNIGDTVYITSVVKEEAGWRNTWNSRGMTPLVGTYILHTVVSTGLGGVKLAEAGGYGWPPSSLTLVEAYKIPTKKELVMKRIKKLWNNSNYVKKNPSQLITT